MSSSQQDPPYSQFSFNSKHIKQYKKHSIITHVLLFLGTFASSMMAGAAWAGQSPLEITNWVYGFTYASLLMIFLSAHEFGHYIAARVHKVDASLPYFIPLPIPFASMFGTLGAYIRTRSAIPNRKALFDIGAAGPLAGFIVCLIIFIIGLVQLPSIDYLYSIHPEYRQYGTNAPLWGIYFGDTLLYPWLASIFASPNGYLPPMNEIYHYPFLCVGWFGMFVTSLNMLPMGQLDGGHITFAMFGSKQSMIARISWWIIFSLGIGSFLGWFYEQIVVESPGEFYTTIQSILLPTFLWIKLHAPWIYNGWNGWLFWALITRFFIKLDHPPVSGDSIGPIRMILGWLSLCIFVVTFAYNGIYEIPKQEDIIHRNIDRNTSKEKKIIELLPQMDIYHDIKTTYGYSLNPCLLTSDIF